MVFAFSIAMGQNFPHSKNDVIEGKVIPKVTNAPDHRTPQQATVQPIENQNHEFIAPTKKDNSPFLIPEKGKRYGLIKNLHPQITKSFSREQLKLLPPDRQMAMNYQYFDSYTLDDNSCIDKKTINIEKYEHLRQTNKVVETEIKGNCTTTLRLKSLNDCKDEVSALIKSEQWRK